MRYKETSRFPKLIGSTGFIVVMSCCLIAVGAAIWFAVSRVNNANERGTSSPDTSYNSQEPSYNENAEMPQAVEPEVSTDVNNSVDDIPYETPESSEPTQEKPSFVVPVIGNVSKGYSDSALQYSATYGDMRLHTGIDILCENGTDIKSAGAGKVTAVTEDSQYGRVITIQHGDNIVVKYCGFGSINVCEGDAVNAETVIGTSGEVPCECSDKPHIHIEATLEGKTVSPLTALGLN